MASILFIFFWFDWQVLKTERFTIIYKPDYEFEAIKTIQNLEHYHSRIISLTGNEPKNLPVVIEDVGLMSNGYADPVFYNIHIFTHPPGFGPFLEGVEDWNRLVGVHEYTHISHMTRTYGIPRILTNIFGRIFQPNIYSPNWIIEGITVYGESQLSPYEGRLNDGFFDNYIGARVCSKRLPTIIEATNEPFSFPYGKGYLYGGRFFNFLAERYGDDKFVSFFKTYGSYPWAPISAFFPALGIDIAAKRVYGKSFPALFSEWQNFERIRFSEWQTEGERITNRGWYVHSLVNYKNRLYFMREIPIKISPFKIRYYYEIVAIDINSKKEFVIKRLHTPLTAPLRIYNNYLYYTTMGIKRGSNVYYNDFRITTILHKLDLVSSKEEVLFKDDIRSFSILPDGSIIYTVDQKDKFGSEIWLYDDGRKERICVVPYLINELTADSNYLFYVARREGKNWNIYGPYAEFMPILNTSWVEGSVNLKDSIIIFSANYDKKSRVYLFNIEEKKFYRLTENGYANFGEIIKDTLYFVGLSKNGFDIYKKPLEFEEHSFFEDTTTKEFEIEKRTEFKRGNYFDILKTLFPACRIPIILPADKTYKRWLYGGTFLGMDAVGENAYSVILAYDQLKKSPFFQTLVSTRFFSPITINLLYDYKNYVAMTTSYPLYRSFGPGISQLDLHFGFRSFDNYLRKEIAPGLAISFNEPTTRYYLDFSIPVEKKEWKSMIDRMGVNGRIGLEKVLFDGELRVVLSGYEDRENPDTPAVVIRGYNPFHKPWGIKFVFEYSHRIINLRWGLWNPNIYFEDIFGTFFFDYGIIEKERHYSTGVEIGVEAKTGFGFIKILPKIGFAINREKKVILFLNLSLSDPLQSM